MASSEGDQLPEDSFDSLLDINEADMFQNKKELQLGKGCLASEVVSEKDSYYKCQPSAIKLKLGHNRFGKRIMYNLQTRVNQTRSSW